MVHGKKFLVLAGILILVYSCETYKPPDNSAHFDKFIFEKEIQDTGRSYLFVESNFGESLKNNHFEEHTWILCNDELDTYFNQKAVSVKFDTNCIMYGSYLFTPENEYLHVRLKNAKMGWIRDTIPLPSATKNFLMSFLKNLIDEHYREKQNNVPNRESTVSGYLTVTHFKDVRYALLKYASIVIEPPEHYNADGRQYGYVADLNKLEVSKNLIGASEVGMGMNFDSNYAYIVSTDPWNFETINQDGKVWREP